MPFGPLTLGVPAIFGVGDAPSGLFKRCYNCPVMTLPRLTIFLALPLVLAFLVPISAHSDIYVNTVNSSFILTDHPNFYHAIADEPSAVLSYGISGGPYGPLFYYPTALYLGALDAVHLIDVQSWHHAASFPLLTDLPTTFLFKLPYLAIYGLVALALTKTLRNRRGETAAMLWLVNPAIILYALLMGQNDGWAFLASVVALALAMRALEGRAPQIAGREVPADILAMVALAAGAAVKLSPILLVIPFALLLGRDLRDKALLAGVGFCVFGALLLPFLWTPYFWQQGLFATQPGKATPTSIASLAVLYAAFVAFLLLRWPRETRKPSDAVFIFVAVHALIYFMPGWNPERSILLIGALCVAVPTGRVFLIPYLAVTAYAIALTLGHGSDLGTGLFLPLTDRVLNIPPLDGTIPPKPLQTILLWLGGLAWGASLVQFWRTRAQPPPFYSPPPLLAPALLGSLAVYLVVCFSFLPRGVDASPYPTAGTTAIAAGQTFSFSFFARQRDLRAITFNVLSDETPAAISVTDGAGTVLAPQRTFDIRPGANRVVLGEVAEAQANSYRVSLTPEQPLTIAMANVPQATQLAWADLNGVPIPGTAAFSVHYQTTWGELLGDSWARLHNEWPTMAASLGVCFGAAAALGLRRRARLVIQRRAAGA